MNVCQTLADSALAHPDQPAIIEADSVTTYLDWWLRSRQLASALANLGVQPGDRVALLSRNSTEYLETMYGTLAAGAIIVPINYRLHPKEIAFILDHSGATVLVYEDVFDDVVAGLPLGTESIILVRTGPANAASCIHAYDELVSAARPLATPIELEPDDLAWLFYTSGTTGRPKGAMVTHGNLAFMTDRYLSEVYAASPSDRALHAGPLTHGSGLWAISLTAGAATHVVPPSRTFDPPEIIQQINAHAVTKIVFLSPTMIRMLLDADNATTTDATTLGFIGYGGAPIHPDDLGAALDRFGPVLCNIFGQGECPMTITMLSPTQHAEASTHHPERLRSVGTPRSGLDVAICDADGTVKDAGEVGEICVRGPVVMRGYWNDTTATEEAFRAGWYHTGDLGRFDDDGYLYLLDRAKELVISGGANVYPREVEDVLIAHPAIRDVAVFGVPDRFWGESVVAAVVVEPGKTVDDREIERLCRENLASYKKPRHVVYVDSLPRSAYGKVLKRELAERYSALVVHSVPKSAPAD